MTLAGAVGVNRGAGEVGLARESGSMSSQSSPRLLVALTIFAAAGMLVNVTAGAQHSASTANLTPQPAASYADQQIHIPRSATAPRPAASQSPTQPARVSAPAAPETPRHPSLVCQAAHGQLIEAQPPPQFSRSAVRQVSDTCDCGQCPSGGFAGDVYCDAEPTCGFGGGCGRAGCQDPSCGLEAVCGIEPSCGFQPACGSEGSGCGGYGCDVGVCAQCVDCPPLLSVNWRRFEFFAGVGSFTGPANHASDSVRRGGAGSFGFYEGVNEARSLDKLLGIALAAQLGMRATQSNLSGAEFTDDARQQIFVTGGFFRRVDLGLQYGLVVDYLYDDWWYQNDLVQLRGELSWNDACGHEFGYQFMAGTQDSTSRTRLPGANGAIINGSVSFEPTDQHRLFLRGDTGGGGSYLAFAGGTEHGDGLLGISLLSAFRGHFALHGGVTYLIPTESHSDRGYANEAWNLSLGVVFRPGGKEICGRYCRPMFEVADNGTFLIDHL